MPRSNPKLVPSFSLYGECAPVSAPAQFLHIEDIQSRSRKYLWRIGSHRHTLHSQCILVCAGAAQVVLEESATQFDGPAVIIIPAGTIHSFRFRPETRGYVLTVDLAQLLTIASAVHQAPIEALFAEPRAIDLSLSDSLLARTAQQLECLSQVFRTHPNALKPVLSWLACSALWTMAVDSAVSNSSHTHSGADLARLRQFRSLLDTHYAQHWPVERYAHELGLSETSLNRLCRKLAGSTGFDLVQQRLALEARRQLLHARRSVSGIATQLGFKDSAYFCRFFRRHSGLSPHAFRQQHG